MVDGLELHRDGAIAELVIDRPAKKNAISFEMWRAIPDLVSAVESDPEVKVLIVRGAGTFFSAGADISEFQSLRSDADGAARYDDAVHAGEHALASMTKPTIAVIRQHCVGGGCQLAAACDFRFTDDTGIFGIPPAKLGIVYAFPSTRRLVQLVGPANAKYLLLSSELVTAERAQRMGLVTEVLPSEELESGTRKFAETLCRRSQVSVRGMKHVIEKIGAGQDEADAESERIRLDALHSNDYAEGVRAFLERRAPNFTQR